MSPNVGNFVHDLVEMAKAMETLPQVQAELEHVNAELNAAANTITDRELRILDLKSQIEALNEKVRQSEVAKDAAETMFLEADDRTSRALAFVKATFGNAGALIQALEPPRPQPTPEPVPVQAVPEVAPAEVKAEPEPIPSWATPEVDHTGDYIPKADVPMHEAQLEGSYFKPEQPLPIAGDPNEDTSKWGGAPPQGQSESPLPSEIAETGHGNTSSPVIQPEPWAGMKWSDASSDSLNPPYSYSVWLAGGGTPEDFHR